MPTSSATSTWATETVTQPAIESDASSGTAPAAGDRIRVLVAAALPIAAVAGCLVSIWFGLRTLAVTLPDVAAAFPAARYALDGSRHLAVATVVAGGGDPYAVAGYLYPPAGAIVMIPLAALGPEAGLWAWFAIKIAIALWCVLDATRGRPALVRVLSIVVVATLLGVLDDLWLGNVSIVMTAAIYLAVSRDGPWASLPLGIVLGAFAKPFLIPFLLWMFVFRRRGAVVAVGVAAAVTLMGAVLMGPSSYRAYLDALRAATGLDLSYSLGLSGTAPGLLVPASIGALVVFAVLLCGESRRVIAARLEPAHRAGGGAVCDALLRAPGPGRDPVVRPLTPDANAGHGRSRGAVDAGRDHGRDGARVGHRLPRRCPREGRARQTASDDRRGCARRRLRRRLAATRRRPRSPSTPPVSPRAAPSGRRRAASRRGSGTDAPAGTPTTYSPPTTTSSAWKPVTSATYSSTPPTIAPSRFDGERHVGRVSVSRNE